MPSNLIRIALILVLLSSAGSPAQGHDGTLFGFLSFSLEELVLIAYFIAVVGAGTFVFVFRRNDKQLFFILSVCTGIFLVLDYLYLKLVFYA